MFNGIYLIIQGLLFFILTPLLIRALGSELYGLWVLLTAIIGFTSVANFGIIPAVVKYVAQFSVTEKSQQNLATAVTFGYAFMMLVGMLAGALLFVSRNSLASILATGDVPATAFAEAIGIVALSLTPLLLSQVSRSILLGVVQNQFAGSIDVLQSGLLLGGALVISLLQKSIVALACWIVLVYCVVFLYSSFLVWRRARVFCFSFKWDKQLIREILHYSLFAWIANLGSLLFDSTDRILVGALLGPAAAGAYSVATGVGMRLNQLTGPLVQVLVPLASSYQAVGRKEQLRIAFRYVSRVVACLLVVASGLLFIWADWFLAVWISPGVF